MNPENLDDRLARLRAAWPARSVVEDVMNRIEATPEPAAPHRSSWRPVLTALAASLLFAGVGLAWFLMASGPRTLLAAAQAGLANARTAHLTVTFHDDQGKAYTSEVWLRRGVGLRSESPDGVLVEDDHFQWSWHTGGPPEERLVVLRQPSQGVFASQVISTLSLPDESHPDGPMTWKPSRAPELDRAIDGHACLAYRLVPEFRAGSDFGDHLPREFVVLMDGEKRVRDIATRIRRDPQNWSPEREVHIEYDIDVPPERVAVRLPEGARVIDREAVFSEQYPLEKALHRIEAGGLLFAVHDVRPLEHGDGVFVVSSVRGTPELLRQFPPRRRVVNSELSVLDLARQPISSMMDGTKYDRILMATAEREGVHYAWWLLLPRKFFIMKDGKRVDLPVSESSLPGEPTRLDDLPGKVRVHLMANFWDEKHRDLKGVAQTVSQWTEVPLPSDHTAISVADAAGRTRRDMALMQFCGDWSLYGVAAGIEPKPKDLRPLSRFEPDKTTDTDYAAAVQRGIDDFKVLDECHDVMAEDMPLPAGEAPPAR